MSRVVSQRPADEVWGVTSVQTSRQRPSFRRKPCDGGAAGDDLPCPWLRDAPAGAFPAEAYRLSAPTAYDLSTHIFACHSSGADQPQACAGFLLRGAGDNLAVRMWGVDLSEVTSEEELYDSYREMAIANGVDPDDPAIRPCRGENVHWLPASKSHDS
ncbi:DUF6283 family protein [Streptomyces sp. NPDC050516]|uniref:DUF6283 family protein n=1 Tax=Streptomyces sp. NPDC050516 TaxID=3365621 RepID=UPI0037880A78